MNEKNTILTPFTIIDKLCAPYAFSRTNKDTLGDKMELYFHDFSFVPLFMQVSWCVLVFVASLLPCFPYSGACLGALFFNYLL